MIKRVFVEHKDGAQAQSLMRYIKANLKLENLSGLRVLQRYDAEGIDDADYAKLKYTIFCEAPVENLYEETFPMSEDETAFGVEYLPGQFDQRADSARQCAQIVLLKNANFACAKIYVLKGALSEEDVSKVKAYLINAVDSREASLEKPETLLKTASAPKDVEIIENFTQMDASELKNLHSKLGLAMSLDDIAFCQNYFKNTEHRDPSKTEIKVLDTYWSDHCRHTTFLTRLENCEFESGKYADAIKNSWQKYLDERKSLGLDKKGKEICLMDIALIGMRSLRKSGKLDDLEESDEINAASIVVNVDIDGKEEEWLVMFKNETHNHPTEIEPFGGAATCLGGAIRDPLSGRSYVYQAMRVTGAADPRTPFEDTLKGKLPQKKIVTGAANGYSSYGNQIGLATGQVTEIYHPGYVAKRMEIGAVVAAAPRKNVFRGVPSVGDSILLVGGRTGRDGIGGATGSSKDHNEKALDNSAEVQKGDAPMERKLQRLFRNPNASAIIKRCNDFGAGGVSVAIGELAPSLEINLDAVPKKYDGLDGTELAISESQERMAVVVDKNDAEKFVKYAAEENLECTLVAVVTDTGRLVMKWRGKPIVDISREFLDTNGTTASARAKVEAPKDDTPFKNPNLDASRQENWLKVMSSLNCCSQKGLVEKFDSSIGACTVNHPYGGKNLSTPADAMSAKIPLLSGDTKTGTIFSFGFNPDISLWSPYHGAIYSILESVAKIAANGGDARKIRFTFQEYFEKLRDNPARWGKPLAALLGAFEAQMRLGLGSIGGKDSMSGSFNEIDVPPTLVSFAIVPCNVENVISPEFKKAGSNVGVIEISAGVDLVPNFDEAMQKYSALFEAIKAKKVLSAKVARFGGIAEAVAVMGFGNNIGFEFDKSFKKNPFALNCGAIVVELAGGVAFEEVCASPLGKTLRENSIIFKGSKIDLQKVFDAYTLTLEDIFPTKAAEPQGEIAKIEYEPKQVFLAESKIAKPKVFIPVFPGTNCEYDTAKAFENAGAKPDIFVLRNNSNSDIEYSIEEMKRRIDKSQILMLPGGFSAGDEPAGSGKFIAAVFRNPKLSDSVMRLLKDRKGLILGICNGFQALIKLGLVPFGEIRPLAEDAPTLTYNNIARHVSCYVRTRVASRLSPWLSKCEIGQIHTIPVSHGEGKFVASKEMLETLVKNGQVATQYVDLNGNPSSDIRYNPNGSMQAIEGITSPCGLVFGKMGHTERFGSNVGKNVSGDKIQPIFEGGVEYFR